MRDRWTFSPLVRFPLSLINDFLITEKSTPENEVNKKFSFFGISEIIFNYAFAVRHPSRFHQTQLDAFHMKMRFYLILSDANQ